MAIIPYLSCMCRRRFEMFQINIFATECVSLVIRPIAFRQAKAEEKLDFYPNFGDHEIIFKAH